MGALVPQPDELTSQIVAELNVLGLHDGPPPLDFRLYLHHNNDGRILIVSYSIDVYDLHFAHAHAFGIARWRHVSVGVRGSLQARLADQRSIGRVRGPGERSPAPLPDWYDLTHVAYAHHAELGLNPEYPVYQLLPPPGADYLNVAESLHLRQPA